MAMKEEVEDGLRQQQCRSDLAGGGEKGQLH